MDFPKIFSLRNPCKGGNVTVKMCSVPRGPGGGGTSILDLTGCAAQQGVLLRKKLCDRVSF